MLPHGQPQPPLPRRIIVNADDFGLTSGVNRGILEAHENGIVTSTSLMSRAPAAGEAPAAARAHPALGFGLHVDLGEWQQVGDQWVAVYQVCDLLDAASIRAAVRGQLADFQRLLDRAPSHLDVHQHAHRVRPLVREIMRELAAELAVPLRHEAPHIRPCGGFWGRDDHGGVDLSRLSVPSLIWLLESRTDGITEITCHPGYPEGLDSAYRDERLLELRTLCAPEVRAAVGAAGIELVSFADCPHPRT